MDKADRQRIDPSAEDHLAVLDGAAIASALLTSEPFEFVFAKNVIKNDARSALAFDRPLVADNGSIPLAQLSYGPVFQALIDDLQSAAFKQIVERKFNLDLSGRPTVISVRGNVKRSLDGHVHRDLPDKIVTVIVFLNDVWTHPGGKLRVLRSRKIEDYAVEISPELGNMLIFRPSKRSWHGHLPHEGSRLSIQFNWTYSVNGSEIYSRHKLNFLNVLKLPFSRLLRG
jgi:SM-20-related protein